MEPTGPPAAMPVRDLPAPPGQAPRALTADAQRAIWLEPRVRRWWYMVLVTALLFIGFCADRLWDRHTEGELIRTGMVVSTKIVAAENKQNNQPITTSDKVNLLMSFPTGTEDLIAVYLSNNSYMTGQTITLHVDPNDHMRWTDRSEPTPLLDSLFVGLIALPIVPLLSVLGYRQLRNLQKLWQTGSNALAVVSDRKQSPIAPLSYAVRCSMQDMRRRDLFTVYVPPIGISLKKGDAIWVITGAKNERPLAALWMPPADASAQSGSS